MNDYEETSLAYHLRVAKDKAIAEGAQLRIGVVGVCTEMKVCRNYSRITS